MTAAGAGAAVGRGTAVGAGIDDRLPGFTATLTRADLVRYAEASGDANPIHLDDGAAQAAGLPGVVAHGMLTLALAGRLVTAWAGDEFEVTTLRTRFPRPVVVPAAGGVRLDVGGRVSDVTDDGSLRIELSVTDNGAVVLLQARAVLTPRARS